MHTRKECDSFIWWLFKLPRLREIMPASALAIIDRWEWCDKPSKQMPVEQLRSVLKSFDELDASARQQLTAGYSVELDYFNLKELRELSCCEEIRPVMKMTAACNRFGNAVADVANTTVLNISGDDARVQLEIRAGTSQAQVIASLKAMLNAAKWRWADCLRADVIGAEVVPRPWHADPIPWPADEVKTKKPSPPIESSELETEDEIEVGLATAA